MTLPTALALAAAMAASAAQSLPELRTEATNGGSVFNVWNTSAQPLTTYLIELVDYPGSSYWLIQEDPVAPGGEKRIPVTNMTVGAAPEYVKITAALYGDGSSAGAPDKVALLVGRRKAMLETTREAIVRVEKARKAGTTATALAAELKQWSESLPPRGRSNRLSQEILNFAAVRTTIANAIALLDRQSVDQSLATLKDQEMWLAGAR